MSDQVKPTKLFMVWQPPDAPDENGYFCQYDTLRDAVASTVGPVEVYEADLKFKGKFTMVTTPVRIKPRKVRRRPKKKGA